ncbi:MAG TPA: 16S rRNA (adenine(1518)-N(6)/adenine(1519)-N(6))-dimethyltransferase RsmA [Thermoanaerobaculia bacterium]|nr:16S rRNA (adenine(1518)-N(6)/adenine(1519)-N(6))-dimethyltransferase RsmA [Thermoanaerobaculia bacterium]
MRPKKRWGQHFLRNRGAVERIVAAIEPLPGEQIVEIGPGEGVLTERLVQLGAELQAIEIDPELAERLRRKFGDVIVNADALTAPLPTRPFRAVGNLPYNAGTPIVRRIIADPHFRRGVFMLQKEVADRLVAEPGDEQYGFLTLYTRLFVRAHTLMTLEPGSFHPRPKVRSAVVVLDADRRPYANEAMIDLIGRAFRMRRKKLINNLAGWRGLTREEIEAQMARAGIAAGARAEELALDDFARLL